ncbi:hypothetical protein ABZ401_21765 [Streptomyces sp. NPDC005892]|uniref:hypothetical protein n=1 Tax=Streptomyces sp. NPDC005892 TaxID=3155593 RepID=UPI0033DE559F
MTDGPWPMTDDLTRGEDREGVEMNHREPQAGRSDEFAGAPGGEAVWETELPWQLPPVEEPTVGDNLLAGPEAFPHSLAPTDPAEGFHAAGPETGTWTPHRPGTPRGAGEAGAPGAGRDFGSAVADTPGSPLRTSASGPAPADEGGRRRDRRSVRAGSTSSTDRPSGTDRSDGEGRSGGGRSGGATRGPASRGHLAKPIIAGAGLLSALLFLAPHLFGDDAPPLPAVQAGAEDRQPDDGAGAAPASGRPGAPKVSPSPGASGASHGRATGQGGHDTIVEVAATVPANATATATAPSLEPASPSRPTATARASAQPGTAPRTSAPAQQWTTTVVNSTSVLEAGQSWSTNRVVLAFQGDGNLVLYDKQGTPLWWSGTVGQGAKAVFQADGNLAVYTQDSRTAWSSRTQGHDGASLVLRADGNMVVQQGGTVLWSSGTAM